MYLSIIIPVYNSSEILNSLISAINYNLKKNYKYEIILINDQSSDNSWEKIKKISKKYKNIKGINLANNCGQHPAIYTGIKFARGDVIITMDDDLQHPPSSIKDIFNKLKNYDLCYTVYLKRKHLKWKKFVSYVNNIYASLLFDKPLNIYISSFRGFSRRIAKKILNKKMDIIFLDGELLRNSKKITNVKVLHRQRFKGESTYKLSSLLLLWFDMINHYHFFPIRFGSLIGLISKFFMLIIEIFIKRKKIKKKLKIKNKTF